MAKTDKKYRYHGSLSGVTLNDGREVMLHSGAIVSLPADNDYVKALLSQKLLTEETTPNPLLERKEGAFSPPPVLGGAGGGKVLKSTQEVPSGS
jgi:hypothetical protein